MEHGNGGQAPESAPERGAGLAPERGAGLAPERGAGLAPERGAGLAEYSLLMLLIVVVCIGALTAMGGVISAALTGATGIFG
jgi:Flp pilus assembly pilin Flp